MEKDLVIENKKRNSKFKDLRDNNGKVQLENKEHAFKQIWK